MSFQPTLIAPEDLSLAVSNAFEEINSEEIDPTTYGVGRWSLPFGLPCPTISLGALSADPTSLTSLLSHQFKASFLTWMLSSLTFAASSR
jgi:hypothetical protein